ncbi:hypothetical protein CANTEDRAFT_121082 [Yamadazyma tenuis ATCC 10573]|uniref:Helicase SWR1 n=1 Tax=Candida tenuis (strain ATCC 10573 / BCRC 21748 / CBS 615 / JCM 9827 / NBRC 10315 / NRRL Y-1498 / VKM Y-70) TaxID=590646 RepID=G3B192_CANTC|nr:uncharacterized protein CANTEDRAFT_121082 [Yamadazyma tenuis ATCC 10573]EGV64910.1 hypothetical protein CANTEDRAFT_121082 [Yamadazyma tenuis ATCC 10573]
MSSSKRRSSSRLQSSSSDDFSPVPVAGKKKGKTPNNKRRKVTSQRQTSNKLVDFITDYNLAVNELFQLEEYGSIVEWQPEDFASYQKEKPQLLEYFLSENKIGLSWLENEEDNLSLDDLPLRLQKKKLAEREQKVLEKYPFRNDVLEEARASEEYIIRLVSNVVEEPVEPAAKANNIKPEKLKKSKVKIEKGDVWEIKQEEEILTEVEYPSDLDEVDTHYKLKDVKFSIPPPKITHPSHIPLWKPPKGDNIEDAEDQEIIEFNPIPIEVISTKGKLIVAPEVEHKLRDFLETKVKTAIIDETLNVDYGNTAEEYNAVLEQQKKLLKVIYRKVTEENSFELNGEKIEKRKLTLPQTNFRQLADPFRSTGSIIAKAQGPTNTTHIDNLLLQGASFAKIHQSVRKQRQLRVRKIATMVDQHFKWKRGEKERIEREREQNLKKISRLAMQAVKKRWSQAGKVYKYLQDQKEEELKKIKGREHLSNMLEHSTQLLEAQLNRPSQANTDDDSDNDSGSDSNDNEKADDTMDDQLSVSELREKYGNMSELSAEDMTNASSVSEDEEDTISSQDGSDDDDELGGSGLAALYGGVSNVQKEVSESPMPDSEYTPEQLAVINAAEKEENGNGKMVIYSDSDSSIPDETTDDSERESDAMSQDEDGSSEEEVEENGLASLLTNTENTRDSDDESVSESVGENSDDDRLSSTDEEDEPKTPKSDPETFSKTEKEELHEEIVNGSKVRDVPIPSLLRGNLRPYQKQGLNWLAGLYSNDTNGILADEMGLGKTIQTISLLSHLATEYHIWGPHLIIVPTSVMLNWEMEFKKFAPGFKVLTYYGSPQQRAQKRKGWNKPDAFHVCITSYQLVVHDHQSFKRRRWRYMILDEAHNIKNFRSNRWKALLNFNTENRLLLTGTPLQNNLMELWSLLYFLMPSSKVNQAMPDGFANLEDFQTWFGKPVDSIMEKANAATGDIIDENQSTVKGMDEETRNTVKRLHQVLRPYILRRLKKDVEKQMPGKYEHIVYCRLSQRQRFLYDDFMSRAKTKETLASGNFLSIINCLMQLRKVCNHPDLFEVRPVVTSFAVEKSVPGEYLSTDTAVRKLSEASDIFSKISYEVLNLNITANEDTNYFVSQIINELRSTNSIRKQIQQLDDLINIKSEIENEDSCLDYYTELKRAQQKSLKEQLEQAVYLNELRCSRNPIYGESLLAFLKGATDTKIPDDSILSKMMINIEQRVQGMSKEIEEFSVLTPKVVSLDMKEHYFPPEVRDRISHEVAENRLDNPFHNSQMKLSIAFPDKSLLQYDCGKLQMLDKLLQQLTSGGHRALIFTQMTKVLDILEQFLNIHGYRYMRLDGSTKIEDRQLLTEKFNRDDKIPVFILSSRSGGLGINLTGADTVIFYDSDWNPAMDKQCQDRCHRIGQSRDVHIYRFVSEHTIESNILKKANQKRQLDNVVIQEGDFTTDYLGKFSVRDLVTNSEIAAELPELPDKPLADGNIESALMQAEDEDDRKAASAAMRETAVDDEDFNEEIPGPDAAKKEGAGEDVDFDEGVRHVDEYMLRFIANGYYE